MSAQDSMKALVNTVNADVLDDQHVTDLEILKEALNASAWNPTADHVEAKRMIQTAIEVMEWLTQRRALTPSQCASWGIPIVDWSKDECDMCLAIDTYQHLHVPKGQVA